MRLRGLFRSLRIFGLAIHILLLSRRIRRLERRKRAGRTDAAMKLESAYARMGRRIRVTALVLQGLMVKVGQFLSTRTDLLPTSFTRELKSLQDAVPGVPFTPIRRTVESELGGSMEGLFTAFAESPLAAASLGQVHIATLADGGQVAVKVQRPGIEALAAIDLRALRTVTRFMERFTKVGKRMQAGALYREFAATVREELDYRREAEHLRRFAKQMGHRKDVVVPRVFEAFSTRRVLVMEYMEGIKVNDVARIEAAGISTASIVDTVIDTYLEQALMHGFVHVDPHPGNLLVLPDGRLCYLDFGMMSEILPKEATLFAQLLLAAMVRDADSVVRCIDALGFLQPHADQVFLKRAVGFMLDRVHGVQFREGPEFDSFVEEFQAFLHDEPLILPAKYMFLGRALGMVIGLVNTLHPNIEWMPLLRDRALPKLQRIVKDAERADESSGTKWIRQLGDIVSQAFGETAGTLTQVALRQIQASALASVRLPQSLERVLDKVERDQVRIQLELGDVLQTIARQERKVWRGVSLIGAAVLIPLGFYFKTHHHGDWMWEAFGLSLVALLQFGWNLRPVSSPKYRRIR